MREQPRTALWRYVYKGQLRWAQPTWLLEKTPEHVVSAIIPGVRTMAPKDWQPDPAWILPTPPEGWDRL